jgi:glycosyltransferase involved in cell wall biosynthesis
VGSGDEEGLAAALAELGADRSLRLELGRCAREHVRDRYAGERLLGDIDRLYRDLLAG